MWKGLEDIVAAAAALAVVANKQIPGFFLVTIATASFNGI
jgi:hypothetical protein